VSEDKSGLASKKLTDPLLELLQYLTRAAPFDRHKTSLRSAEGDRVTCGAHNVMCSVARNVTFAHERGPNDPEIERYAISVS
jgi:hypothetical protein